MLELAAKAAGYQIVGWNEQRGVDVAVMKDGSFWQPLLENHITDCMGDALRLMVKLRMMVSVFGADVRVDHGGRFFHENGGSSLYAATRRAIVRAAAEIGRAME